MAEPGLPRATSRLVFRRWRLDDVELALDLWGDSRVTARIMRQPLDRDAVAERLAREIEQERRSGMQYWPIFLQDGEHVGCAGLRPHTPEQGVLELGFQLRHAHWGKGLASEAAASVIEHAFESLGAAALFAGHHPENISSRRVLEKLGFVWTHDELYPPTGLVHPSYSLHRR